MSGRVDSQARRLVAPTALVAAAIVVALWSPGVGARADGEAADAGEVGPSRDQQASERDVRAMLDRARAAMAAPHSGRVTTISFTESGPRVAELEVVVRDADAMLRRPARVIVGPSSLRAAMGADGDLRGQRVPASPLGFDVDAILARWEVAVGPRTSLDTGPAVPVHLVRRSGSAIRETLFVDVDSGMAVRRETRAADGRVLRVVAYTRLAPAEAAARPGGGDAWGAGPTGMASGHAAATAAGFDVPLALDAGFVLVAVEIEGDTAIARYSDGLSVVSIYQEPGALDHDTLHGGVVRHVAKRDVWTWPGLEPVRFVWTGDGRTWTAISDAPAPVIEDALAPLPGDLIGHDAPSRVRRGLTRVWRFVTTPLR